MDDNGLVDGCVSICMNWITIVKCGITGIIRFLRIKQLRRKGTGWNYQPKRRCGRVVGIQSAFLYLQVMYQRPPMQMINMYTIKVQHIPPHSPYSSLFTVYLFGDQLQFEKLGLPSAPPAAPWALQRQCWGNRSLMSVAVGAGSPWNVQPRHPGNTTEPMSPSRWRRWLVWVGQVRIPKLLDWWGEGQIEAKIAKIGRQKLNKTSSTTRQSQQKGARDSWSHFRKQN